MAADQPQKYDQTWGQMLESYTIPQLQGMIQQIDARSKSLGLGIKEMFAMGSPDVDSDENLFIEQNDKLSKNDLARKKNLIQTKINQKQEEAVASQAKEKQKQEDAEQKIVQHELEQANMRKEQAIAEYKKDPRVFFASVLNMPNQKEDHKLNVFTRADQIIAACPYFGPDTEPLQLWKAWEIVAEARDSAAADFSAYLKLQQRSEKLARQLFSANERYVDGAKQLFKVLLNRLPKEFIGLQFLYDVNLLARVQLYLQDIYTGSKNKEEIQSSLANDIIDASNILARRRLSANDPRFKGATEEEKKVLIEQTARLLRLDFEEKNQPEVSKPIINTMPAKKRNVPAETNSDNRHNPRKPKKNRGH